MTRPSMRDLTLDEMEQTNKKWFEEFKAVHHEDPGYYQTVEIFLRYSKFKGRTFDTFTTRPDIEDYILTMWERNYSPGRTDGVIAAISSFKNFLITNYSFPQDFLFDILSLQVNEKSVSDSSALNLSQLHYIRKYNSLDITDEYIFEIYFQLGIDKKYLSICIPQNAVIENRCFRYKDKTITYNERICQLLDRINNVNDLKMKMKNVDYHYFKKVTDYLIEQAPGVWRKDRALCYSDVLKSHQRYIIRCPNPNCEELSENIQQNWVLVKTEFDAEYRLDCCWCKGRPYEC